MNTLLLMDNIGVSIVAVVVGLIFLLVFFTYFVPLCFRVLESR